ncbi:MAG: hypothetical protein AAF597_10770, partial [Bacteroidota bacterium]
MDRILTLLAVLWAAVTVAQPLQTDAQTATRGHYIFTVYTPTSTQEQPVWTFGETELTTHRLVDRGDSSVITFRSVPHTCLRTYFSTEAHSGANPATGSGGAAGAVEVEEAMDGPAVAEVLHYPFLLSPMQRQLTESYLAIKHGLTLDQRLPTNYLRPTAGGSQPVWTATTANEFRHRIIGLAQDPSARLQRRAGHSVLAPQTLSLGWEQLPDATAYLLLADNGAPTARTTGEHHLQRRWRVQTTGSVPQTTFTFDTRQFFDRAQPGEVWHLAVEYPDGNTDTYPATTSTDARLVFSDVDFPADGVTHLSLITATAAPLATTEDFFSGVLLSPNP